MKHLYDGTVHQIRASNAFELKSITGSLCEVFPHVFRPWASGSMSPKQRSRMHNILGLRHNSAGVLIAHEHLGMNSKASI
jgi:hypothetical protein